ncbi:MAG TPA: hypothetical protein VLM89_14405, partial [Phycisphaerae bacterium]|nr:hypothetical protein [Phycisphaerae bacterium]
MTPNLTTSPDPGLRSRLSWPQRLLRSNGFAWSLSIALHAVLFLVFWMAVLREASPARRAIIPEARLAAAPGPTQPLDPQPMQLAPRPMPPLEADKPRVDEAVVAALVPDEPASLALPGTISLTAQAAAAGPQAPLSSFFGQSGNAYRVVYVVDVSASLMIYIDDIIQQMRSSIHDLVPTQRFHIVLARPQEVEELPARRLVPAIARYKKEADLFLSTIDRVPKPGKADPIEAMRRAFAVGPELIYFLSDGDYADI